MDIHKAWLFFLALYLFCISFLCPEIVIRIFSPEIDGKTFLAPIETSVHIVQIVVSSLTCRFLFPNLCLTGLEETTKLLAMIGAFFWPHAKHVLDYGMCEFAVMVALTYALFLESPRGADYYQLL